METSSLIFLNTNIAKAISQVAENYGTVSPECSAIMTTLNGIHVLLDRPHALASQIISQSQLETTLTNAYSGCGIAVSMLGEEAGKQRHDRVATGECARRLMQGRDDALVKALLQQIHKQLGDISLLILAVQRKSTSELWRLLGNEAFIGRQMNTSTAEKHEGHIQPAWNRLSVDSKSVHTQASNDTFHNDLHSRSSRSYHLLSDSAGLGSSSAPIAPARPEKPEKPKKVPRAQMSTIFFKLFKSNTELHRAAQKGDVKKTKALIDLGVDINYEGSSGCTALHLATDHGHEAMVRLLLQYGANPAAKSSEGRTPLHSAARMGKPTIVRLLLEKINDVHVRDPSGSTALHIAAFNGQESVVQILLEEYPGTEVRGPSGFTALHVAAFNGQSAVVRLLVELGANLEARSDTGRTSLQLAAERGHEAVVRYLLLHDADVMAKDDLGRTALQGAVSNQHGIVAQLLLDKAVLSQSSLHQPLYAGSVSGIAYEMCAADPALDIPGSPMTRSPVRSPRDLYASICELPSSSGPIELPADEVKKKRRIRTSISQQTGPPSYWRCIEDT